MSGKAEYIYVDVFDYIEFNLNDSERTEYRHTSERTEHRVYGTTKRWRCRRYLLGRE